MTHSGKSSADLLSDACHELVTGIGNGVDELRAAVSDFLKHPVVPPMSVKFDEKITAGIKSVEDKLAQLGVERPNTYITKRKIGKPNQRFKTTRSILSLSSALVASAAAWICPLDSSSS